MIHPTVLFPRVLSNALYIWACCVFIQVSFDYSKPLGPILALTALILTANGLYLYYQIVARGAGSPSQIPELVAGDIESRLDPPEALSRGAVTVKANGDPRRCSKCQTWKPDRTHHCSSCNDCCLRMDHHCPWFATCIGLYNHKYFIQFLLNSVAFATVILITTSTTIYTFFRDGLESDEFLSINLILLAILALAITISVGVFSAFSIYLVLGNLTTIEFYDYNRYRNNLEIIRDSFYKYSQQPNSRSMGNVFDLGSKYANWCAVMGSTWREWLLPVPKTPTGDYYVDNGILFPVNKQLFDKLRENTRIQQQLLNELHR